MQQNPIRLVIKKEKATVWYYVDLKSLPEGFYSLIISAFSPLFCLWIEHQCKLVYTHNAEQIKNKDDKEERGEAILILVRVYLKKRSAQGLICTI